MARTSRVEKTRTRQRLVATASREFRAHGVAGTSIPRVMEQVGLTQGTFYAHFASKDALVASAVEAGLREVIDGLLGAPDGTPAANDLGAIIASYLSVEHRDNVAGGCVLPALAGEIRREPEATRQAFTGELERFFARLAPLFSADDAAADHAMVLVAGMAGALLLARATNNPMTSEQILRACRNYYTGAFTPQQATPTPSTRKEGTKNS